MKSLSKQKGFFGISGSAIVGAVGALGAGALAYQGTQDTNDTNTQNAFLANANSERLANTAHQREVNDLIAAGLNPILSANKQGAGIPQQAIPQISNPMMNAASSAHDHWRTSTEAAHKDAERRKTEQAIKINDPLSKLATDASSGYDDIKAGVQGAVSGALESILGKPGENGGLLGAIQSVADKIANITSTNGAQAVDRIGDASKALGDSMSNIVSSPKKYVEQRINSASEYYRHATAPARAAPAGEVKEFTVDGKKFKLSGNAFSGNRATDLKAISEIKNPVDRWAVRRVYQQWQYEFKR